MRTLAREEALKEFERFWNDLKEEWFKVEVLQDYSGEDFGPSFKTWIEGDREKSIELLKENARSSDWAKTAKSIPAKKVRIHIVDEPYSEYLKWEIEHYKLINIPLVGEEVYLIKREDVIGLDIPDGDFMIFDNTRVVRNYYTPEGKMYKADFYDESDDISKFLELKEKILSSDIKPLHV